MDEDERLIIEGYREDGSRFRPSDWIERISGMLARYGPDHRLAYAKNVRPCIVEGEKCLVVERELSRQDPAAYDFILNFARTNRLRVQEDRRVRRVAVSEERRERDPVGG